MLWIRQSLTAASRLLRRLTLSLMGATKRSCDALRSALIWFAATKLKDIPLPLWIVLTILAMVIADRLGS